MSNPYVYDRALTGREGFHNRSSELMRICSRVTADRPQSVSVVGAPQTGKTSLLNYLLDLETRSEALENPDEYIFLVLSLAEETPDTPEAFFRLLASRVSAGGHGDMEASHDGFSELVKRLMAEGR